MTIQLLLFFKYTVTKEKSKLFMTLPVSRCPPRAVGSNVRSKDIVSVGLVFQDIRNTEGQVKLW